MKPKKEQLFYFDCEWVPVADSADALKDLNPELYDIFVHQTEKWNAKELEPKDLEYWWEQKAHFHPEFCKIITVSYGYFHDGEFIIRSVYGEDEEAIMTAMAPVFNKVDASGYILCGYAIKRFDMPWLGKRMMANGVVPPKCISVYGQKPWEVNVFDLPEVWSQGCQGESYTPFEMACTALGIPSSKDDISGREVKDAYYRGEMERIKAYCEKDVQKTMELATRLIELMP